MNFRTDRSPVIRAGLMAALCCAWSQGAVILTATPGAVALTCNTLSGPGDPASIVIKPAAPLTTGSIIVTAASLKAGVVVTPPLSTVLNAANQSQGIAFNVNASAGCAGSTNGSAVIQFFAGVSPDVTATANLTVTAALSPLVASPVTLTCVRSAGPPLAYTPGPVQAVSVTSAAAGGTPFTVNTSANPSWLTVTPATGGAAGIKGAALTVSAVSPCGNYAVGSSHSGSIHLRDLPAPDGLIPVTLQILGPSPLTASQASPTLSYTKGSASPASVDVLLSASGSTTPSFSVDTTTLPAWLSVNAVGGATPQTLRFTTTTVADSMTSGAYSATVHLQTSGAADLTLPFRLTVNDPPPALTVAEGTARNLSWTIGQPLPIPYITLASTGAAIPYTITTGGVLAPIIGSSFLKGFAYNYPTPIPVTFDQSVFAAAQPGVILTGTVTVTWGSPVSTTAITINIAVQPGAATVLAASPLSLPTAASGQVFTVALSGSGFVAGPDAAFRTTVGVVSGGSLLADPNISANIVNASNIILTITVPAAADAALPFAPSGPGGTMTLGVCNPLGTACTAPTGTATVAIVTAPVVQVVTSASSYVQASPPSLPVIAPYDMISLFGFNFCTAGGTGCGTTILYGRLDPATWRYPTALSPDPAGEGQRQLTVIFQTHATPPVVVGGAPLLFATDGQVNLLVPAGVAAYIGKALDLVVSFGASAGAPVPLSVVAADPGIFAVGADGKGEGAILGLDWARITAGNEAGMRQNAADSDTVQIFTTGLGAPDSSADNTTAGSGLWPADCAGATSFLASLNLLASTSYSTLDGALVSSGLLYAGRLAPCLRSAAGIPTVTIGGQPATVTYAGWVPGSVAGLYQVNARLPGSGAGPFNGPSGEALGGPLTVAAQLPVVISARGRASQPGVTLWVAPRLKVTGPASASWAATGSYVTASEGTPPYQFALTAGSLPAGLSLNAATGALSGTPAANAAGTYSVTVTAVDSASTPLTGSVTFPLTVQR